MTRIKSPRDFDLSDYWSPTAVYSLESDDDDLWMDEARDYESESDLWDVDVDVDVDDDEDDPDVDEIDEDAEEANWRERRGRM